MARVIDGVRRRVADRSDRVGKALRELRRRYPWVDHMARAAERYRDKRGNRLGAAIAFYAFLSFFPLVAIGYALLGYLVGASEQAREYLVQAINELLPGLAGEIEVAQIAQAWGAVGLLGVAGLIYTGLGCMNALREALRDIWLGDPTGGGNFLLKKLHDIGALLFLGVVLITSVAGSTVTGQASHAVLQWLGLEHAVVAGLLLRLLTLSVTIGCNTLIFLMLFSRLSGTRAPWRSIAGGALFGAVGFEILKQVGALLVARTAGNPVYASFAVVAGLLVWIYLVARFVVFAAAWTATRSAVLEADAAGRGGAAEPHPDDAAARERSAKRAEAAGATAHPAGL